MGNLEVGVFEEPVKFRNGEKTLDRTARYGGIGVFSLFHSDYFIGEVLEGHWLKEDDGNILGPPTMIVTGGELQFTGRSDVGGTTRRMWITSKSRLFMYPGTTVDVHLKLPSLATANAFYWRFILHSTDTAATAPVNENNIIVLEHFANTTEYRFAVRKRIEGTLSYVVNTTTTASAEGTFRMKVLRNGKFEFYFHEGAGDVSEEDDQILTQTDLELNFDIAYVSYELDQQEATNRTMASEMVTVSYPRNTPLKFERSEYNRMWNIGGAKAWDYDDALSVWQPVYNRNHERIGSYFNGLDNDLRFVYMQDEWRVQFQYWDGTAFRTPAQSFTVHLVDDNVACWIVYFRKFVKVSRDEVVAQLRLVDSSPIADDEDYYADVEFTLKVGSPYMTMRILKLFPEQKFYVTYWQAGGDHHRFGYVGDAETHGVEDDELSPVNVNNTTMSDNYGLFFDHAATYSAIPMLAMTHKPNSTGTKYNQAWNGGQVALRDYLPSIIKDAEWYFGITRFDDDDHLFLEAENGTYGGTTTTDTGQSDDSGDSAQMLVNPDYVRYSFTAGTDLPAGRYLAIFRIKDLNQVTNGVGIRVYNDSDSEYRNEENAQRAITVTASFAYYQLVFDITDEDVTGTDTIFLECQQILASNDVWCDYFLIIPVTNGDDWAQDIAHNALREFKGKYRVAKKRGDDRLVG